jgi:hypothetical protein
VTRSSGRLIFYRLPRPVQVSLPHVQEELLVEQPLVEPGLCFITRCLSGQSLQGDNDVGCRRVLNRAVWSSLAASRILLGLLLSALALTTPLVFGIDDTIER